MDKQAVQRLTQKNEQQDLVKDLQGYRLSPIEARAVYHRISQYLSAQAHPGLENGQIFYTAIAYGEPAGKPIKLCKLVRVRLTLDDPEDLKYLEKQGGGVPALREARLFRMALEAVDQGARLTQEDFVRLLGVDLRTVRRMIRKLRQQSFTYLHEGIARTLEGELRIRWLPSECICNMLPIARSNRLLKMWLPA